MYFFNRSWEEFRQGFGTPSSHYWVGLDRLHDLTQSNCIVHFDLQLVNETWYFAEYSTFVVGDSSSYYSLTIGGYTGTIGDAMAYHNGYSFTTYDADHDGHSMANCANSNGGGFWYNYCAMASITVSPGSALRWMDRSYEIWYLNAVEVRLLC